MVVADDLLLMCEPEMQPAILAIKKAILAWAGQEQAGSVQLLPFINNGTSECVNWSACASTLCAAMCCFNLLVGFSPKRAVFAGAVCDARQGFGLSLNVEIHD